MPVEKLPIWIAINKLNMEIACSFIVKSEDDALEMAKRIFHISEENIQLHLLQEIPFYSGENNE